MSGSRFGEAMATAKGWSRPGGVEGLEVRNSLDVMFADDGQSLAHAVSMLLRDRELRRYGKAGSGDGGPVDWLAIGERFSGILRSVVEKTVFCGERGSGAHGSKKKRGLCGDRR